MDAVSGEGHGPPWARPPLASGQLRRRHRARRRLKAPVRDAPYRARTVETWADPGLELDGLRGNDHGSEATRSANEPQRTRGCSCARDRTRWGPAECDCGAISAASTGRGALCTEGIDASGPGPGAGAESSGEN